MAYKFSFDSRSIPPKSVVVREAKRILEELMMQNQKRMHSKGFISTAKSIMMNFVGKRFINKKTRREIELDQKQLDNYNKALKTAKNQNAGLKFSDLLEKLPKKIQIEFRKFNPDDDAFEALTSDKQKDLLYKFLETKIQSINDRIQQERIFSNRVDLLTALSGVRINKLTTKINAQIDNIETSEVYKRLVEEFDSAVSKLQTEKDKLKNLSKSLDDVKKEVQTKETRREIREITAKISDQNVRIRNMQSLADAAEARKRDFERSIAREKESAAKVQNKDFGSNIASTILDNYKIPKTDGTLIKKGTQDARAVEQTVQKYTSSNAAIYNSIANEFKGKDDEIFKYFDKLYKTAQDDLAKSIRDFIKARNYINLKLQEYAPSRSNASKEIKLILNNDLARLKKNEQELTNGFKKIDVKIDDITKIRK